MKALACNNGKMDCMMCAMCIMCCGMPKMEHDRSLLLLE